MKKYLFVFIALILSISTQARQGDTTLAYGNNVTKNRKPAKPPVCYLGLSTGINNAPGVFGLDFNIRLGNFVTLDAGVGPSTWGNKIYAGAKYYLKEAHRGWALGGGLTYNSGVESMKLRLNTIYGTRERVALSLKPKDNAFVAIYHYWTLGRKYNRFYVDLGKSVPLHPPHYHELYGDPLTDRASQDIKRLAPGNFMGGMMIGAGFSFGLYRK